MEALERQVANLSANPENRSRLCDAATTLAQAKSDNRNVRRTIEKHELSLVTNSYFHIDAFHEHSKQTAESWTSENVKIAEDNLP